MKFAMNAMALAVTALACGLAQADTGKLLLTGGVSSIDGAAGGGLTPWAVIGSNATEGEKGASAYLSRHILKAIGVYGEAVVAKSTGGEPWEGTVGFGATLKISEHAWWDFAVYKGISRGAADWNHSRFSSRQAGKSRT